MDGAGNIYIADTGNNRIQKVTPDGVINTVAGSTSAPGPIGAYGGDGGPAVSAKLHNPMAIAVDGAGNIYIADFFNNRIRKVTKLRSLVNEAQDKLFKKFDHEH